MAMKRSLRPWSGAIDDEGRPHGHGTMRYGDANSIYHGEVRRGARHGEGVLRVFDADADADADAGVPPSVLRVAWDNDEPRGAGVLTEPSGASVIGFWDDGATQGLALELHPAAGGLRYVGRHRDGERCGFGVELLADGGALVGTWAAGALHGPHCAYLYPCSRGSALVGEWNEGDLESASLEPLSGRAAEHFIREACGEAAVLRCESHTPMAAAFEAGARALESSAHPALRALVLAAAAAARGAPAATLGHLCKRLLPRPKSRAVRFGLISPDAVRVGGDEPIEPWEASRVRVEERPTLEGGDWGGTAQAARVIASTRLRAGDVAAFYDGHLVEGEPPFGPLPSGTRSAEDVVCTATGDWLSRRQVERVTAGWSVRHGCHRANCCVEEFEHPILGACACLRVTRAIAAGEELLVNLQHLHRRDDAELPGWYKSWREQRNEDGYYSYLQGHHETLLRTWSDRDGSEVRVVAHGPWRVLWIGTVEQGMTYHGGDNGVTQLIPGVIGFDYQRTMVATLGAAIRLFGSDSDAAGSRRRVLLVGLGAGSCAVALRHLGAQVVAVELDEAVVRAACDAHSLPMIGRSESDASRALGVVVEEAGAYAARLTAGSFDGALLDAYDGGGCVPSHLQEAAFVRHVAACLVDGGAVVANLFNGTDAARASCDAFARTLRGEIGPVIRVPVVGHEDNIVLIAVKTTQPVGATRAWLRAGLDDACSSVRLYEDAHESSDKCEAKVERELMLTLQRVQSSLAGGT